MNNTCRNCKAPKWRGDRTCSSCGKGLRETRRGRTQPIAFKSHGFHALNSAGRTAEPTYDWNVTPMRS